MRPTVKAKKHLGQHFLIDQAVISRILMGIQEHCPIDESILEVGPGPGVLTEALAEGYSDFRAVEFDRDMMALLIQKIPLKCLINEDFLALDLETVFEGTKPFNLVGNFPYNISSQIVFKMLTNKDRIPVMVGMFQKEVAERICATPGGKKNGIITLRVQAHYEAVKLFDIGPDAFDPPPKVNSSVILLKRKEDYALPCGEKIYAQIIKLAFQQRRKKIRNTLKSLLPDTEDPIFQMRPEQLGVQDFINIAKMVERHANIDQH